MQAESVFSRNDTWISSWVGEELLMMSAESSAYLNLGGTGGRIWELLEQPQTVVQLCDSLARTYAATPAEIRPSVEQFLQTMLTQDAVRLHASTGA